MILTTKYVLLNLEKCLSCNLKYVDFISSEVSMSHVRSSRRSSQYALPHKNVKLGSFLKVKDQLHHPNH